MAQKCLRSQNNHPAAKGGRQKGIGKKTWPKTSKKVTEWLPKSDRNRKKWPIPFCAPPLLRHSETSREPVPPVRAQWILQTRNAHSDLLRTPWINILGTQQDYTHTHISIVLESTPQLHRTSVQQGFLAGTILCTSGTSTTYFLWTQITKELSGNQFSECTHICYTKKLFLIFCAIFSGLIVFDARYGLELPEKQSLLQTTSQHMQHLSGATSLGNDQVEMAQKNSGWDNFRTCALSVKLMSDLVRLNDRILAVGLDKSVMLPDVKETLKHSFPRHRLHNLRWHIQVSRSIWDVMRCLFPQTHYYTQGGSPSPGNIPAWYHMSTRQSRNHHLCQRPPRERQQWALGVRSCCASGRFTREVLENRVSAFQYVVSMYCQTDSSIVTHPRHPTPS